MRTNKHVRKIESLLNQAEAAFDLTQDELTHPEEFDSLWQRANYRLSLAQAYIGLVQVQNIETVAGAAGRMADSVEKENN